MKLRSENNLDGDERRNAETGAANVTSTDAFMDGEQTLIRTDRHHHDDPEQKDQVTTLSGKESKNLIRPWSVPRLLQERKCCSKKRVLGDQER